MHRSSCILRSIEKLKGEVDGDLAFEMAKIARYWQAAEGETAWMKAEKEICSPLQPIEVLSQRRSNITNPILLHSRGVWSKVHKMFKITHTLQRYSSLWDNPNVCIGKKPVYWKQWHARGLNTINDLFEDGVFLSYDNLLQNFELERLYETSTQKMKIL